jgi:hypothetical protein
MNETPNREPDEIYLAELASDPERPEEVSQGTPSHQVTQTSLGRREIGSSITADSPLAFTAPPPIPEDMDNVSAVGGAVGALTLGVWSIVGSFITPWAIVNSMLGILLGLWGLTSRHRRWASVGMILCGVGFVLATIQISELIQYFFRARETLDS